MTRLTDGLRGCALTGVLAVVLLGCALPARSQPPLAPLLDKIAERNAIGDAVALSKWDSGKPVLDQAREAAVLQNVRDQAPAHGLDPDDAARFFGAQIEANKSVQYALLNRWHERGRAPDTARPDLSTLRVRLDALQGELLDALAKPPLHAPRPTARPARRGRRRSIPRNGNWMRYTAPRWFAVWAISAIDLAEACGVGIVCAISRP